MRKLSREPLLDISWYGHSCFRLGGRGLVTVVTDPRVPVQRSGRGLKADVICLSQGDAESPPARDGRDAPLRFARPGEYEVGGMFLRGIALHAQQNGAMRRNVAWLFHFGELNLLHPGALGQIPEQDWFETLGEVHVLLLPLGGGGWTRRPRPGSSPAWNHAVSCPCARLTRPTTRHSRSKVFWRRWASAGRARRTCCV